ncbi:MAG: FtsX-like permease family protein [Saprospiraceae bacterium]|nr:FtsX-like permease family protein [Saprospiraceae bacterium]
MRTSLLHIWRQVKRYRVPYLISTFSLALALVAFFLISRYLWFHFSIDSFHHQADQIVRLNTVIDQADRQTKYAATAFDLGPNVLTQSPGFTHLVRVRDLQTIIDYQDIRFDEDLVTYVDSAFFDVFSFPLIMGSKKEVLKNKTSIVITREVAEKYFKDQNPVGTLLKVNIGGEETIVTIEGVVENPPHNSSLEFSVLANIELIAQTFRPGYASLIPGLFTYFKIEPNTRTRELSRNLQDFITNHLPEELAGVMSFEPVLFRDVYFITDCQFDLAFKGNKKTLLGLLILALLTLLIAIINFININTALSIKRSREIAIRKILGISECQMVSRLLFESAIIIASITAVAFLFTYLIRRNIDDFMVIDMPSEPIHGFQLITVLLSIILILTLVVTVYPAYLLTRLPVIEALRKKWIFLHRQFDVKKILLGIQFCISVFFIIMAWVVFNQLSYMATKDPGFGQDNIILVNVSGLQMRGKEQFIKDQLIKVPGVRSATISTSAIYGVHTQANFSRPDDSTSQSFLGDINYVDPDFLTTYQAHLIEGRDFSAGNNTDVLQSIMINERAAHQLGLVPGKTTIGTVVRKIARDTTHSKIIGVVADYHSRSMHQEVSPMIWQIMPESHKNVMALRLQGETQEILSALETSWSDLNTGEVFDYTFLNEMMENAYRSEQQLKGFVGVISIILLLITSAGMFGMMLFITEQKSAELGIRKMLGANAAQLMGNLHRPYLGIMAMGFLVASLAGIFISNKWLESFAYRIDIGALHILGAGIICFVISTLAVLSLTYRATRVNVIETIRTD